MPIILEELFARALVGIASAALAPAVIFTNSRRLISNVMDYSLSAPDGVPHLWPVFAGGGDFPYLEEIKPASLTPYRIDSLYRLDHFARQDLDLSFTAITGFNVSHHSLDARASRPHDRQCDVRFRPRTEEDSDFALVP